MVSAYVAAFKAYSGTALFGGAMRRLFKQHELPTTVPGIDAWLSGDLSWVLQCSREKHRLRLVGDKVEIVDHDWSDLPAEVMLAGLCDFVPSCLDAWSALETGAPAKPRDSWSAPEDHVLLRGARAWAGIDVSAVERGVFIAAGTTPEEWEPWAAAGVAVKDAAHFLRLAVPLAAALPWIEARVVSKAAAVAAARGEEPVHLDLDEWKAHGFSARQARNWTARVGCAPEEAREFGDLGAAPSAVESARQTGRTFAEIVEWIRAGVSPADLSWWKGCSLDYALKWTAAGVRGMEHQQVVWGWETTQAINGVSGGSLRAVDVLDPADVAGWFNLGLRPYETAQAIDAGFKSGAVSQWGGIPQVPVSLPFYGKHNADRMDVSDLLVVTTAMDKSTWDAWVSVTGPWEVDPSSLCAEIMVAHGEGVTPSVLDEIPATGVEHFLVQREPTLLALALGALDEDLDLLHRFVAAGWMQDALIAPSPNADSPVRIASMVLLFEEGYTPAEVKSLDLDSLLTMN